MGLDVDAYIWYGFNDEDIPDVINPRLNIEHENKNEWDEYCIDKYHITPIWDYDVVTGWGVILFYGDRVFNLTLT